MQIEFTVPGEPFGKQRPRHSRVSGTTYTPKETKLHEQLIQWAYRRAGGHKFPEDSEIRITIIAVMGIPKSTPKYLIILRYGLTTSGAKCSYEEIGKQFNVTRERIRQLEAKALNKLKILKQRRHDE